METMDANKIVAIERKLAVGIGTDNHQYLYTGTLAHSQSENIATFPIGPWVDGELVQSPPNDLIKRRKPVRYLLGTTKNESRFAPNEPAWVKCNSHFL